MKKTVAPPAPLQTLMRYWRGQRGLSQLDLALRAGVSQRHLSFVESGRSVPSRPLLFALADALTIPLRERNALLLAAGYAPAYQEPALDDATMQVVSGAMDQMLRNHEPHPALLMDRYWNVMKPNAAATAFFQSMIDIHARPKPRNLLELIFDPAALRPFVEDWERVAAALLDRVYREAPGQVLDSTLQQLLARLHAYPGAGALPRSAGGTTPIVPMTFRRGAERTSYFSLITTVGMPQTITAQELRLECMFPMEPPSLRL